MKKTITIQEVFGKNKTNSKIEFEIENIEEHIINNIKHYKYVLKKDSYFWFVNDELHHENDEPAFYFLGGLHIVYAKNGIFHRDNDLPAVIMQSSEGEVLKRFWYINGKINRKNDKPAVIYENGTLIWYKDNLIHRDNDKPALIDESMEKQEWYINGLLHRENGYAIISKNNKFYALNGKKVNEEEFNKFNKFKTF